MRLVLVLGTGTAVGKTYVTCHLARAVASLEPSLPVLPLKPVETGLLDPSASDAAPNLGISPVAAALHRGNPGPLRTLPEQILRSPHRPPLPFSPP